MDAAQNPYAPGAGTPPPLMAGRGDLVSVAEIALTRAKIGRSAKSFVAVGLRGVGKTVVLNKVQDIADSKGYQSAFIEAEEDIPFVKLLVPQLKRMLFKLDRIEGTQEKVRRGLRVLKGFVSALKVQYGDFEAGLDFDSEAGTADGGDLAIDLPELFVSLGEAAADRKTAIALIVDEIQYLSGKELSSLISSVHKVNQKQLPIVVVGAGLPQVLARMGNAKSYAERLFEFPRVDALTESDAEVAIVAPAKNEGVAYEPDALAEIVRVTQRYPYFLQEWGYVTWNIAQSSPITLDDVLKAGPEALRRLDQSFFRMRLDRMTPTEKKYIRAMAELGPGPHRSGDIARAYGAQVTTVAPIRSSLISKGMIYSPAHGETSFTVPLFDEFMRREIPDANEDADL